MKSDLEERHPGYWTSPWPVECGGNRRQKAAAGRLDAKRVAQVVHRENGRWNVMVVQRGPGEFFLQGTMPAFTGPAPFGWVERIDSETLEPLAKSPELPCGGHVWCGAIVAHADGSLYTVNGNHLHRLDPQCQVLAERKLPIDRAHNGLLVLSDGTIVTKDLRLEGQGASSITLLAPGTLELIDAPIALPEASMGRIAADRDDQGDWIYVTGSEHVFRLRWDGRALRLDESFRPRYRREGGDQGLAWDSCLSDGAVWLMDNGDIEGVRRIFSVQPNGRFDDLQGGGLSWRIPAPWKGAQRLLRIDAATGDIAAIAPIKRNGGAIIAPPVFVPELGMAVAWDSVNGGIAGVRWQDGELSVAWRAKIRPSMQPIVHPESGELVINDFRANGSDDLVVLDLETGALRCRTATGSKIANGMFLTPGAYRDVYYCTTGSVSRVAFA